ncbi:hypothetical protein GJ744_006763 [Endocarpon pusillum]|uniref:Uncharacterized protein n=1 Tax=Endocarpon pusillum TaxID=364733 RepID=A0A8H7DZ76_9EURO|nr:hypothetical protein GJ744_006763 [Endocarpon pusillum]
MTKVEAETVQETVVTSDEEWEEELSNNEISQGQVLPSITEPLFVAGEAVQSASERHSDVPQTAQRQDNDPIPRLYPIYLPFRAQHQVLALVQSILEECCFDFGNSWIPELMKENNWEEAESIELTQWINRFSKHADSLPQVATKAPSGKGLKEVLSATSTVRNSAVHRLRTSATEILEMLDDAVAFTEALNDIEKATRIEKVKSEFRVIIDDVVEYQTLLACKLSNQLKDLARRRAEIDELQR